MKWYLLNYDTNDDEDDDHYDVNNDNDDDYDGNDNRKDNLHLIMAICDACEGSGIWCCYCYLFF